MLKHIVDGVQNEKAVSPSLQTLLLHKAMAWSVTFACVGIHRTRNMDST